MSDTAHLFPASTTPARHRVGTEEPGLCALEDYTCLAGESVAMRSLRAQLRRVSPHFRVALITGEEGTCAEVVALALHRLTAETDATFLSQTASSLLTLIPEILTRPGGPAGAAIERNTLFLQEAGDLTYGEQMYLLRALQRIASFKNDAERPRIIFASGRDLRTLSGAGKFDRNLYRKMSAVEIVLPPLRLRPEDIPLITCGLLSRSARSGGLTAGAFDGRALSRLQCYDWPGNVRELEHVVEIARQNAGDGADGVIETVHLPPLGDLARTHNRNRIDSRVERLEDVIQSHVLEVLLRCSGNKVRAAERLGISRSTLYRMLDANAEKAS